jgi:DNA-binding response OmpR family regulator
MSIRSRSSDRILILGDESKSASALERILKAAGYDALYIVSVDSAREMLRAKDYALVIIEPSASRMAGTYLQYSYDEGGESLRRMTWANKALELCRDIRRFKSTTELPVMVVAKSQRPQDKITCLNAGASDYISKPYQRAELLSRVRAHLKSWHHERDRTVRFEQLNVLHAVSSVLTSSLDPEVLVRKTLEVMLTHLQADAGVAYLRSPDTGLMGIVAAQGFIDSEEERTGLLDLYHLTAPLMTGMRLFL